MRHAVCLAISWPDTHRSSSVSSKLIWLSLIQNSLLRGIVLSAQIPGKYYEFMYHSCLFTLRSNPNPVLVVSFVPVLSTSFPFPNHIKHYARKRSLQNYTGSNFQTGIILLRRRAEFEYSLFEGCVVIAEVTQCSGLFIHTISFPGPSP